MAPRVNTIPDPSVGRITCSRGLNTYDDIRKLRMDECSQLLNLYPGDPVRPRFGNRDVFADNAPLGFGYDASGRVQTEHTTYTPYAEHIISPDGDEIIFAWGKSGVYYILEMINITDATRSHLLTLEFEEGEPVHFKFVKIHSSVYCVFDKPVIENDVIQDHPFQPHRYITEPIIIYWTGTTYSVRQMGIEVAAVPPSVDVMEAGTYGINVPNLHNIKPIVYNNEILYISNVVLRSTDGKRWRRVTPFSAIRGLYDHTVTVFQNKIWVIGGQKNRGEYSNKVYSSTDAVNWEQEGTIPRYLAMHAAVVHKGRIWVIGGFYKGSATSPSRTESYFVYSSADGITWDLESSLSSPKSNLIAFTYNDEMYVSGGRDTWEEKLLKYDDETESWGEIGNDVLPQPAMGGDFIEYGGECYFFGGSEHRRVFRTYEGDVTTWEDLGVSLDEIEGGAETKNRKVCIFQDKIVLIGGGDSEGPKTVIYSTEEEGYGIGENWHQAAGGPLKNRSILTSFTFIRRTDEASKFNSIDDYVFEPWETVRGETVTGIDERKLRGTVTLTWQGEVTGIDTDFNQYGTQLSPGDHIRIGGRFEAYKITEVTSETALKVVNTYGTVIEEPEEFAVLPKIGDSITTYTYNPGDVEGVETGNRPIVTINTQSEWGRLFINMPAWSIINKVKGKGATHLRYYRSVDALSVDVAAGLSQGWVVDISISDSHYFPRKIFRDDLPSSIIEGRIALNMTQVMNTPTRVYSVPPLSRYAAWDGRRLWLAAQEGNIYCSEVAGGDGGYQGDNSQKYTSEFSLSTYFVNCCDSSVYKISGLVYFNNDIIVLYENKIFCINNANRLSGAVQIGTIGCICPESICLADHPDYGTVVFFVSNEGPAIIRTGNIVELLYGFKVSNLWPGTPNNKQGEIHYNSGTPLDWESRNLVTAHYSNYTYWVHYGDTDGEGAFSTSYKCFGYHLSLSKGALEVDFPTAIKQDGSSVKYEPQAFVAGRGIVYTLSHKKDLESEAVVYRVTRFLDNHLSQDMYIDAVDGPTAPPETLESTSWNTVKYTAKLTTACIPLSNRDDLASEVFNVMLYFASIDDTDLKIYLQTDSNRIGCDGTYSQQRQSGVRNLNGETSFYRFKLYAIPKAGLLGNYATIKLEQEISQKDSLIYFGAAIQAISRNLPSEFLTSLGSLSSEKGALKFVVEADETPSETEVYS